MIQFKKKSINLEDMIKVGFKTIKKEDLKNSEGFNIADLGYFSNSSFSMYGLKYVLEGYQTKIQEIGENFKNSSYSISIPFQQSIDEILKPSTSFLNTLINHEKELLSHSYFGINEKSIFPENSMNIILSLGSLYLPTFKKCSQSLLRYFNYSFDFFKYKLLEESENFWKNHLIKRAQELKSGGLILLNIPLNNQEEILNIFYEVLQNLNEKK